MQINNRKWQQDIDDKKEGEDIGTKRDLELENLQGFN